MKSNLNIRLSLPVLFLLIFLYIFWPSVLLNEADIVPYYRGYLPDRMYYMYLVMAFLLGILYTLKAGTYLNLLFMLVLLSFKSYLYLENGLNEKPYIFIIGAVFNLIIAVIAIYEIIISRNAIAE